MNLDSDQSLESWQLQVSKTSSLKSLTGGKDLDIFEKFLFVPGGTQRCMVLIQPLMDERSCQLCGTARLNTSYSSKGPNK